MWTWWLGAQTHNLKLRISFRFTSNSDQIQLQTQFNSQSFRIQITIIPNSNHNHVKFNSDFKSHSLQIQFLFKEHPSSASTSFQAYGAPKVRTCWLANALYFLKARLGSWFILAISRMFRFGISDSSAGDEAQFLDVAMFQGFYSHGCCNVSSCLTLLSSLFRTYNIIGTDMH